MIKSFIIFDDTGLCHYYKEIDPSNGGEIQLEPKVNGDLLSGMLSAIELLTKELVEDKMIKIEMEDNWLVFQRKNFSKPDLPVWLTLAVVGEKTGLNLGDLTYFSRVKGLLLRILHEYGRMFHGQRVGSAELDDLQENVAFRSQKYRQEDFDNYLIEQVKGFNIALDDTTSQSHIIIRAKANISSIGDAWRPLDRYFNEYLPSLGHDVAIRVLHDGWLLFYRNMQTFKEVYASPFLGEWSELGDLSYKKGNSSAFSWDLYVKQRPTGTNNKEILAILKNYYRQNKEIKVQKNKNGYGRTLRVTFPNFQEFIQTCIKPTEIPG